MSLKALINPDKLPKHIAVIMDGNGRWAKSQGLNRIFGHRNGVRAVHETTEACAELGVKHLTLYAFSTENWSRPQSEVNALMELLVDTVVKEEETLLKNDIRLSVIGDFDRLPKKCQNSLHHLINLTKDHKRMELILALSYSSRQEITNAAKQLAQKVSLGIIKPEDITEEMLEQHLYTRNIPDPELMIRTSGEQRISNYLLWQCAYAEFYFTEVLWPDFRKEHLYEALVDYQSRERRFGKTSEQIKVG